MSTATMAVNLRHIRPSILLSTRSLMAKQLVYNEYGDPAKIIRLETVDLPDKVPSDCVLVKWLASPINPADINQLQGVYPVKPTLPAIGGNEGYGRVEQVGSSVKGLQVGNHVIPAKSGLGSWRSHGHHKEADLFPIDNTLPLENSATLQVNPPTAYRMLKDFVNLKEGDTVIQNGANSAVGKAVIQICKIRGLHSVNVVRKRDQAEFDSLKAELQQLGADIVVTEEQLLKEYRGKVKNVRLALNCVGGRSTTILAGTLGNKGIMVTYGGMSKQPLQIPTGPLIFKDIRIAGFWMSRWYEQPENKQERELMYADLGKWIKEGKLKAPKYEKKRLEDYQQTLESAQEFKNKYMLVNE